MADEDKGGSSGFDVKTAVVVLAVLGGAYLVHPPLKSARPAEKESLQRSAVGDQVAPARLWDDPIEAAKAYREKNRADIGDDLRLDDTNATATAKARAARDHAFHGLTEIAHQIVRHQSSAQVTHPVTVLEVMTSGGSYAEDAEERHRSRYAVVSALGVAGYVPWDAEHLGYSETPWPRGAEMEAITNIAHVPALDHMPKHNAGTNLDSTLIVPFEWFQPNPLSAGPRTNAHILVLWLNADSFEDHPLIRLAQLNHLLRRKIRHFANPERESTVPKASRAPEHRLGSGFSAPRFKLMEPRLHSILPELKKIDTFQARGESPDESHRDALSGLEVYSSWSTTADAVLHLVADRGDRLSLTTEAKERGIKFQSLTCTDDQLMDELIDELHLRGVEVANMEHKIVLVSESETLYGRALPLTFAAKVKCLQTHNPDFAAAVEELRTNTYAWPKNIHLCSYMRGIDGKVPGESGGEGPKADSDDGKGAKSKLGAEDSGNTPKPEGHGQMDYIPRFAGRLEKLEEFWEKEDQGQLKAIGVLGSDIYDKLLVLQALRPRFTDEIFFTTDLDARMLHPQQLEWTRNLIVASSFGLQLHEDFQKEVPPFRDTYQCGQYLACLAALDYPGVAASIRGLKPRRFEIGRRGAADLSTIQSTFQPPIRRTEWTTADWKKLWLWVVVGVMIALLAALFSHHARGAFLVLWAAVWGRRADATGAVAPKPHWFPLPWWAFRLTVVAFCLALILGAIALSPNRSLIKLLTLPPTYCFIGIGALGLVSTSPFGRLSSTSSMLLTALCGRSRVHSHVKPPGPFDALDQHWWLFRLIVLVPLLVVIALCICIYFDHHSPAGEPFSLFDGISVWPTEVIRIVAASLALHFLFKSHSALTGKDDLNDYALARRGPPWSFWKSLRLRLIGSICLMWHENKPASRKSKSVLYSEYTQWGTLPYRIARISSAAICYALLTLVIYTLFDSPFNPTRGKLSLRWDTWVEWISNGLFGILVLYVADAGRLCRKFIDHLVSTDADWRCKAFPLPADAKHLPPECLNEFLDLKVLVTRSDAVGKLVFYPFFVLFLLVIARNNFFDRWDWPPSLLLFLGLLSAYAIYILLALRNSAEEAREAILKRLNQKYLTALAISGGLAEQIGAMIKRVQNCHDGAFAPIAQQPVIKALLMPFGGAGLVTLLNYLATKM